ncbi:hypothetical protein HPB48_001676 [Haemaphysalis longicornis]|uniref:Uncharacterized protein n=1 Tax=Haemaphysalis longicornis TaxID=44386 RepID=A0A9J6GUG8_HAELO|nr:hypothetical protein HPB48_001676 [Haemaphysalis longicornis]
MCAVRSAETDPRAACGESCRVLANGRSRLIVERKVPPTWHDADIWHVLQRLGREGPSAFYAGAVAEAVSGAVHAAGGVLSAADLARHLREGGDGLVEPASTTYRGVRVHTAPLPSHGSVLLEALNLLEGFTLRGRDCGSYQHLLVEALRTALADGLAWVAHGGPAARDGRLAAKEHAASRPPLDPDR